MSMEIQWESGFTISVRQVSGEIVIEGNRAGLRSLANLLNQLADMPEGAHVHLDEYNSLEEGSLPVIIDKI